MKWQETLASVADEGFILSREVVDGEIWAMGLCPKGHDFRMRMNNLNKGQRCRPCRLEKAVEPHLKDALEGGLAVVAELRSYGNRRAMYLVGQCPVGHLVAISVGNFAKGVRCGQCRIDEGHRQYLDRAASLGFTDVGIDLPARTDCRTLPGSLGSARRVTRSQCWHATSLGVSGAVVA